MLIQPIKQCYWVVPDLLLAGEYPRDRDETSSKRKINALLESGITTFIDLTDEDEGLLSYSTLIGEAFHHRFPIRDVSVPASPEITTDILDTIDRHIEQGHKVYVHCWGGVGRTGIIVGCWLVRHGLVGEAALGRLRELWQQCPKSAFRESPETPDQERYILAWKAE